MNKNLYLSPVSYTQELIACCVNKYFPFCQVH